LHHIAGPVRQYPVHIHHLRYFQWAPLHDLNTHKESRKQINNNIK
jgi:hypothetical protein